MGRSRHIDRAHEKHRIRVRAVVVTIILALAVVLLIAGFRSCQSNKKDYVYDSMLFDENTGAYIIYISNYEEPTNGSKIN